MQATHQEAGSIAALEKRTAAVEDILKVVSDRLGRIEELLLREKKAPEPVRAPAPAPAPGPLVQTKPVEIEDFDMFCYQCEQTKNGQGCDHIKEGVCKKKPTTSALQDLLVHAVKGLASALWQLRQVGKPASREFDIAVCRFFFSTLTNVNFDDARFLAFLAECSQLKSQVVAHYKSLLPSVPPLVLSPELNFSVTGTESFETILNTAQSVGIKNRREQVKDEDIFSLQELLTYGLKGLCAYADHASVIGFHDDKVYAFTQEALHALTQKHSFDELLKLCLRCGEANLWVMALLDKAHTTTFGHPVPTDVNTAPVAGKCILVSGHDLFDLFQLLKQTEGKGINVYTHGEMLPAHGYPGLKQRYPHLVGNYGGAWQKQQLEFPRFPGPIVMTTNCLTPPKPNYADRVFTRTVVGFPNTRHFEDYDFTPVIKVAQEMAGFTESSPPKLIKVGFGRNAVLGAADKILGLVSKGALKHIFLIGGCDGFEEGRSYYRDLALSAPKDTLILTLACGKYRFIMDQPKLGDIEGIPRVLDVGQCNDAYSAVQIAVELAKALKTDVNSLPLSIVLSWFEQKAVAVLLTLLHLGLKNMRIGPRLPAFLSPKVLGVLVNDCKLKPIGANVEEDLKDMLNNK